LEHLTDLINQLSVIAQYFIGFVVLLGVLIFVHEFGHFIIAKLLGVKVLKFSLGFPPALIKRKWGETEYMLSWVPLGGYVKLLGEDPESDEEIPPEEQARAFTSKPLLSRIAVIAAGPIANYLLAVVLLSFGYLAGHPVLPLLTSQIGEVMQGSPAMEAGFKAGDVVKAIDGTPVQRWDDLQSMVQKSAGKKLSVTLERDGGSVALDVTPKLSDQKDLLGERVGIIGVKPSDKTLSLGFFASINAGIRFSGHLTKLVVVTLVKLVKGEISLKALNGPITIVQAAGESIQAGVFKYLFVISFISINLAVINLLPIPILDGGHIMFFLIEAIIRKPVTGKIREIAVQLGLLFIIFLMVLVFYNDISRILTQGWSLTP
jgi:regulator of sigma E protease